MNHEKENFDHFFQVQWAGFDKLEAEGGILRQVLLLGYSSGFQVWDVEEADDVHQLVSRHDGPVSFLQMARSPASAMAHEDRFGDARPLLAIAGASRSSEHHQKVTDGGGPASCSVHFYSLKAHAYVHGLDFASAVYAIRCSPRVVAVSQANQVGMDMAFCESVAAALLWPASHAEPNSADSLLRCCNPGEGVHHPHLPGGFEVRCLRKCGIWTSGSGDEVAGIQWQPSCGSGHRPGEPRASGSFGEPAELDKWEPRRALCEGIQEASGLGLGDSRRHWLQEALQVLLRAPA